MDDDGGPEWLFEILERKRDNLPNLGKVRVISVESWEKDENDEDERWETLPNSIKQLLRIPA